MNKSDLIAKISADAGINKVQATAALQAVERGVMDALANGEDVSMTGFGTFSVKETAARAGRNPKTGEPIEIAAGKKPVFKAGQAFKNAVKVV